jgi:putative ABC transport system permease protein
MKVSDIFSYAFGAIRLRKLRAGLTTLGVVIGIAAIVALLSISQGLQDTITVQLQKGFATDTLIVSVGGGLGFGLGGQMGGANSGFSLLVNDTETIDALGNVSTCVAVIQKVGYVNSSEGGFLRYVVGVDFSRYASVYSTTFEAEFGIIPLDPSNDSVVIGRRITDPWNNGTSLFNVDDVIEILWTNATVLPAKNDTYAGRVSAVLKEVGGLSIGGPSDFSVYIPISQAKGFFGTDKCDMIIVKLENDDEATIESASEAIKKAFSDQVTVTSSTAILNILSTVFSTIELFLGGIAAISLLVAGIGIMNIMIVSLMERTREIGILKALGAKNRTVLLIFLCEAVIIGLLGAVIGVGSGWVLANVVAIIFSGGGGVGTQTGLRPANTVGMTITPILTLPVFLGALVFGVMVSVVFALYPAWRASRLKPVEALRYE